MSSENDVALLLRELNDAIDGCGGEDDSSPTEQTEEILSAATENVFEEQRTSIDVDGGFVKQSLPAILVLLVASRSRATHGKKILGDVSRFFGVQLSPGTVYPSLHELVDQGILERQELSHTKAYSIHDPAAAYALIEDAMAQNLLLGNVFREGLRHLGDVVDVEDAEGELTGWGGDENRDKGRDEATAKNLSD